MQIENNLTLLSSILKSGRYILFSSDGVWGLSCNALHHVAVHQLIEKSRKTGDFIAEFLVSDLEMLKKFTVNLHPRIETLLVYHERPLRIKCESDVVLKEGIKNQQESFFRIVKDKACRILINEVNHPIFTVSFLSQDGITQLHRNDIKVDLFADVDFIASEPETENSYVPLVKVDFDEDGIIDILK
jgi:L-threonylcarbamoyladenylate synthase